MSSAFGPSAEVPPDEEWMMCGVCAVPLHHSAQGWFHAREEDATDHLAVPVPLNTGTMAMRCDVCDGQPVTHLQDAQRFHMAFNNFSAAGWTLCRDCAQAASVADLSDPLLLRYLDSYRARYGNVAMPREHFALMHELYQRLQENRIGWPVPLGQAPTSGLKPTVPKF